jgi:hypothetical protein
LKPFGTLPMRRPVESCPRALTPVTLASLLITGTVATADVATHGDVGFRLCTVATPAAAVFHKAYIETNGAQSGGRS